MRISEKERLTELYHCLKAVPEELWESSNYEIVRSALKDKNIDHHQSISFHIFGKLAHNVSDENEFVESIRSNKIDGIELQIAEQEEIVNKGVKKAANQISKGEIGDSSDSLRIFQLYYAQVG